MKRFVFLLAAFLVAAGVPSAAFAADPAPARSKKDAVAAHVRRGAQLYDLKQFAEAAAEFEQAFKLSNRPAFLYNAGQAYRKAGMAKEAIAAYQSFLRRSPDSDQREDAEGYIAALSAPPPAPPPPPPPPPVAEEPARPPVPPAAMPPGAVAVPDLMTDHKYALGVRIRYLFVTQLMFAPYLAAATDMNGVSVAAVFEYRRPNFDVVTSLDYSWFGVNDGNWLTAGHDPTTDTKYAQFQNLSFLSADVSLIGHRWLTPWMEIRGGAGLGIGVVFGNILLTANANCSPVGKTPVNWHDTTQCYPLVTGPIVGGVTPQQEQALKNSESSAPNLPGDPHRKAAAIPPVMGVVNIEGGMRFKVHRHVLIGWEIGFRDSMFVGIHSDYRF